MGLHEHGLEEELNGRGYGGDIHVFNETKLIQATGRRGGNGCVVSDQGASWDGTG